MAGFHIHGVTQETSMDFRPGYGCLDFGCTTGALLFGQFTLCQGHFQLGGVTRFKLLLNNAEIVLRGLLVSLGERVGLFGGQPVQPQIQ